MSKKMCGIYCIENIVNHRKYIGMSRNIDQRWYDHKSRLKSGIHNNQYLQRAWDKYGELSFHFYIIELCDESILSERECYYIKLHRTLSHENGYNLTTGGENTSIGKVVICLKNGMIYNSISDAAKHVGITSVTMIDWCRQRRNYMYLDEFNALSQEEKEYWCNFNWDEVIHAKLSKAHSRENLSEETILKLRMATSGKNNPRAYSVYCPQLNESFDCIKDAGDKYNINRSSISQCIKGKLQSAGRHPVTGEKLTWKKI